MFAQGFYCVIVILTTRFFHLIMLGEVFGCRFWLHAFITPLHNPAAPSGETGVAVISNFRKANVDAPPEARQDLERENPNG